MKKKRVIHVKRRNRNPLKRHAGTSVLAATLLLAGLNQKLSFPLETEKVVFRQDTSQQQNKKVAKDSAKQFHFPGLDMMLQQGLQALLLVEEHPPLTRRRLLESALTESLN